jgi:hypothetical protein
MLSPGRRSTVPCTTFQPPPEKKEKKEVRTKEREKKNLPTYLFMYIHRKLMRTKQTHENKTEWSRDGKRVQLQLIQECSFSQKKRKKIKIKHKITGNVCTYQTSDSLRPWQQVK